MQAQMIMELPTNQTDPDTGEPERYVYIRRENGQLMTHRVKTLAEKGLLIVAPDHLMDEVKDLYNQSVDEAGLPDWVKSTQTGWPKDVKERQKIIAELLRHRHDMITLKKAKDRQAEENKELHNVISVQNKAVTDLASKCERMELACEHSNVRSNILGGLLKKEIAKGA